MAPRLDRRALRWAVAALAPLLAAVAARAQGYTVAAAGGRAEPRPATAARLDVDSVHVEKASAVVALPFPVWVYGRRATTAVVSAFGWIVPGAAAGFAGAADPAAPHGQDPASGAFPYAAAGAADPAGAASADGVVAPFWTAFTAVNDGTDGAGAVFTWTTGAPPRRRFVVSWEKVAAGSLGRVTVQAQFEEGPGTIVFAYAADPVTGEGAPPPRGVCGLDEPGGARFTAPAGGVANASPDAAGDDAATAAAPRVGLPPTDLVLTPRAVLVNSESAAKRGDPAVWSTERSTCLSGDAGAKSCSYLGQGTCWFFAGDRVTRGDPARARALAAEDRASFPSHTPRFGNRPPGDPFRWVRQVLDGKAIFVPADGGPPLRLWFRVVEWFSIDDRGLAGRDDHVWNLRILLSMNFPDGDPRGDIDSYVAWRAMARGRLTVGKLFAANEPDDAAKQYDTGRAVEYVQWCARFKTGVRGPMPDADCPRDGWTRFPMKHAGETDEQHADRADVRFVPDPNYVESGYDYIVLSADELAAAASPPATPPSPAPGAPPGAGPAPPPLPPGWICRRRVPPPSVTDEPLDFDPPAGR